MAELGTEEDVLPRIVYRTHYQAIGLDLFDLAIFQCLSPIRNEQRHVLEHRISRSVTASFRPFNPRAAGYLLDEFRALGICNRNYVLAPLSIGYRAIAGSLDTTARKWFYLSHFLKADGAILVEFMAAVLRHRVKLAELYQSRMFDDLLVKIYEFYLLHTMEVREKVAIRADMARLKNMKSQRHYTGDQIPRSLGLEPKTRKHKVMFHVEALVDLGLIGHDEGALILTPLGIKLQELIPDLQTLERVCESQHSLEMIVNETYALVETVVDAHQVLSAYQAIRQLDIPLVSVDSVYAAINSLYAAYGKAASRKRLESVLAAMRKAEPTRLHIYRDAESDFGAIQFMEI
jgi:hypothetical protein